MLANCVACAEPPAQSSAQLVQLLPKQRHAVAVAAAAIGQQQNRTSRVVTPLAQPMPPAANRIAGQLARVGAFSQINQALRSPRDHRRRKESLCPNSNWENHGPTPACDRPSTPDRAARTAPIAPFSWCRSRAPASRAQKVSLRFIRWNCARDRRSAPWSRFSPSCGATSQVRSRSNRVDRVGAGREAGVGQLFAKTTRTSGSSKHGRARPANRPYAFRPASSIGESRRAVRR